VKKNRFKNKHINDSGEKSIIQKPVDFSCVSFRTTNITPFRTETAEPFRHENDEPLRSENSEPFRTENITLTHLSVTENVN
jgi:hypothetical protein